VIFLRHPKPAAATGLCYGRTDLDIAPEGAAQIETALRAAPRVRRVIASPALRCRKLAESLAARDGVALELDERLWELDMGVWDGMQWDDIPRPESEAWLADPWNLAPPGGETFRAVHARVSEVIRAAGAADTALVCHAGPIRAARIALTGANFEAALAEPVPYATPILLAREPG
jgi:alpha-ribazole phosphatase